MLTCHHNGDVTIDGTRYSPDDPALPGLATGLSPRNRERLRAHLAPPGGMVSAWLPGHILQALDQHVESASGTRSAVISELLAEALGLATT